MTAATMGANVFEKSTSDARQQPPDTEPAPPKRMNPNHLRRTLYWLTLDWIHLQQDMPTPSRGGEKARTSNVKTFGHPAEWASVKCRDIVDLLTSWHEYMADYRGETGPRKKLMRINDDGDHVWTWAVNDKQRMSAAWKYLEPRCEQLVELVDAEALKELPDLHFGIRRAIGASAPKYTLPIPCPNNECELRTLVRIQGVGQDFIACDACGYTIKEAHYPLLVRMTLDAFISSAAE